MYCFGETHTHRHISIKCNYSTGGFPQVNLRELHATDNEFGFESQQRIVSREASDDQYIMYYAISIGTTKFNFSGEVIDDRYITYYAISIGTTKLTYLYCIPNWPEFIWCIKFGHSSECGNHTIFMSRFVLYIILIIVNGYTHDALHRDAYIWGLGCTYISMKTWTIPYIKYFARISWFLSSLCFDTLWTCINLCWCSSLHPFLLFSDGLDPCNNSCTMAQTSPTSSIRIVRLW